MDTRNKIISPERATSLARELRTNGSGIKVVTGYFDVLLAEHVRRLVEVANGLHLFVVVLDPPEPLLAARARAELVAALAVVDYVVPAGRQAAKELLRDFQACEIVEEEAADLRRIRQLTEHVQRRQQP